MRYIVFILLLALLYGCGITEPVIVVDDELYYTFAKKKPKEGKVTICEKTGSGKYIKKLVKEKKVQNILDEGGGFPGDEVPDINGYYVFSEVCESIFRGCPDLPLVDYEGGPYKTVLIGEQCWLKENLNIGNRIDGIMNSSNNGIIEKYCFENDDSNCDSYGGLYMWPEAMQYSRTAGSRGICPQGWHVPTANEYQILKNEVQGRSNSLKAVETATGTNSSGFSALMAGERGCNGSFGNFGNYTWIWSSNGYGNLVFTMRLKNVEGEIYFHNYYYCYGWPVRCIKD